MIKYYKFIKYILENNKIELNLIDDFSIGKYFIFDIEDFGYNDKGKRLDYVEADDLMEKTMNDTKIKYRNKNWHVKVDEDVIAVCPKEYKEVLNIIINNL